MISIAQEEEAEATARMVQSLMYQIEEIRDSNPIMMNVPRALVEDVPALRKELKKLQMSLKDMEKTASTIHVLAS